MSTRRFKSASIAIAAALVCFSTMAQVAYSREPAAQRARPAANGSWNRTTTTQRTADGLTRNATTTGPNGAMGTYASTAQRTDDGYVKNVTRTGPEGATRTRDIDVSCDKDAKSCTKSVSQNGGAPAP